MSCSVFKGKVKNLPYAIKMTMNLEYPLVTNLANFSKLIFDYFDNTSWAGFYLTGPDNNLYLGPFQGDTATPFIEYGKGVCGSSLKDKEAIEYLSMNIAANMFGLGYAATPSGLKGIKRLKEISTFPEGVASDEMITFLVLNTAGVTLIPTTVISIRKSYGSKTPTDFVFFAILSTLSSCVFGLLADKLLRKPYSEE